MVGVDPRWVKNALVKKHYLHFGKDNPIKDLNPSSYLEKIFQVPFNLKTAEDESVKSMIKALITNKSESRKDTTEPTDTKETEDINIDNYDIFGGDSANEGDNFLQKDDTSVDEKNIIEKETPETEETIAPIQFTEKEAELLQEMSVIIGSSPRAIKRFINIYRIVKAHENFGYTNNQDINEMLAVMFLLALPLGKYKKLTKSFFKYITNDYEPELVMLSYFDNNPINSPDELDSDMHSNLRIKLVRSPIKHMLHIDRKIFNQHLPFIKRFAYNL